MREALPATFDNGLRTLATCPGSTPHTSAVLTIRRDDVSGVIGNSPAQRRFVGPGLHNANRHDTIDGPGITVSPVRATLTDSRPSCREAVLDAIDRLQRRTGATEFARRDIVAEVRVADASFERQTIYRCLRRLAGHEPGSAHHDLHDVGNDRMGVRP